MAPKIIDDALQDLVERVLLRLARDPQAAHLWQWEARPDCADEPAGLRRRNHLKTLLGLLGAATIPGVLGACKDDLPALGDAAPRDGGGADGARADARPDAPLCGDDPCSTDAGLPDGATCGDDPCATDAGGLRDGLTKRDGMACADDPCACADDPCACGDDPCAANDLGRARLDGGFCSDDPCACADDPCGGGGN